MITAETDPFLVSKMREKDTESIISWFQQHQKSLYILGMMYLRTNKEIEDVFYRSIVKIYDERKHVKKETSFDSWVTSIFITICREYSSDKKPSLLALKKDEEHQNIFYALDQLEAQQKEAIVLAYLSEFSLEEAAKVLQISMDTVKTQLFSGIQLLKEKMKYDEILVGCKEYHPFYIDYLRRTIDRTQKVEFEMHIYHCHGCQDDLATFQEVTLRLREVHDDISLPPQFLEKVKDRVVETEMKRAKKNKKRKSIGLAFASILTLMICTGFVTNSFSNVYYSWVDWRNQEDEQLRFFLQNELGERLNLEEVSNGVKVRIKSAIADDVQTLIYYEIEDTNEDNRYMMSQYEGLEIENEIYVMSRIAQPRYSPPVDQKKVHNEAKNIYKGTISLLPIAEDRDTIQLNLSRLQKLPQDLQNGGPYGEVEFAEGEWSFDIPVTKHPSIEHELDMETKIDGIPIRFEKLTIAPTVTLLQYSFQSMEAKKRIEMINFDSLETNNKKVEADLFGGNRYMDSFQEDWRSLQASFETLYLEEPEEVKVRFGSIHLTIEDHKTIEVNPSKDYPQTFEYVGNTISIDKVLTGSPGKIVLTHDVSKDRVYESVHFQVINNDNQEIVSIGISGGDGVLMDKNGKKYKIGEIQYPFDQIEHPRYFETKQEIELYNDTTGEDVIPKKLEIRGYNTTKYVDDTVNILLD
ncbi:sigma-70 family RNA polymerase sigma factor [Rossellomorea aquimaris]|uniref:sigma-70 family RNA polymerase sigma factor n=1 Tax=Rossellomorea aquimaris TaxID=189382 RepID=UPI0007D05474|nr:sigma-70 family RNA polymerase sigma factor [Rossellomorea aquimaris]